MCHASPAAAPIDFTCASLGRQPGIFLKRQAQAPSLSFTNDAAGDGDAGEGWAGWRGGRGVGMWKGGGGMGR